MSSLREAATQALEALEADNSKLWPSEKRTAAITALKAALEADDGMYGTKALTKAYENGWNAAKAEPEGGGNLPPPLSSRRSRSDPDNDRYCMAGDVPPDKALAGTWADALGGGRRRLGPCH